MIFIRQANPGNGKSYFAGVDVINYLKRNIKWYEGGKTKVRRKVATNIELNPKLMEEYRDYLVYWDSMEQLIALRNCDVIFDDMGSYLDSQEWQRTPRDVKRWFRLHEHYGCDIYGNCQDFKDIVGSVRKLTVGLEYIRKLCGSPRPADSKPEVKRYWGVFIIRRIAIDTSEKPLPEREFLGWPRIEFLKRKYCNVYNTLQDIQESPIIPMKHDVQYCRDESCEYHRVPKIIHT